MFRRAKKSAPSPVAACPSCGSVLEKRPQRKKKCPACGNYIYVKTRPGDRKKVLATKEEAERIDKEWAAIHDAQRISPEDRRAFEEAKAEMRKKRRIDPSEGDVWWAVYNKRLAEYASRRDWGLYRNTRCAMAEQVVKEGRKKAGLCAFLEVWYLDANGPRNVGGMSDPSILREFPPFDPGLAFQAPAVVHSIQQLAAELALNVEGLRDIYFETASRLHNAMGLPVEPARGWDDLSKVLGDRSRKTELKETVQDLIREGTPEAVRQIRELTIESDEYTVHWAECRDLAKRISRLKAKGAGDLAWVLFQRAMDKATLAGAPTHTIHTEMGHQLYREKKLKTAMRTYLLAHLSAPEPAPKYVRRNLEKCFGKVEKPSRVDLGVFLKMARSKNLRETERIDTAMKYLLEGILPEAKTRRTRAQGEKRKGVIHRLFRG